MPIPSSAADAAAQAALAERTFRDAFAAAGTVSDMDAYVRREFSPRRLRSELANPDYTFFLAFADDAPEPTGYAKLHTGTPDPSVVGRDPIEIKRLYVGRDAIGRGLGAALMRSCLQEAARLGRGIVWLAVWERNDRAIAFYESWGFRVAGTLDFWLGSSPQNGLVMVKPLE